MSQTAVIGWLFAVWGGTPAELSDLDGAIHQAKKTTKPGGLSESGPPLCCPLAYPIHIIRKEQNE